MHHKPETINVRPPAASHSTVHSHVHAAHPPPVRSHPSKGQNPLEQASSGLSPPSPPRRAEITVPTEAPHRYIFLGKPDSGNEITLGTNWKPDKKPVRFALSNRPRPRPVLRPTTDRPLDRHVFVERPTGYPSIRKPPYPGPQRPPLKTQNAFVLPHRPPMSHQPHQESNRLPPKPFTLQIDHQDKPPRPYPDNTGVNNAAQNPSVEQNHRVPIGATEYHNPSHPKPISEEHSQVPITVQQTPQVDHSQQWQTHLQTEQTLLDPDIGASEYVNYQNRYHEQINKSREADNQIKKGTMGSTYPQSTNQTMKSQTPYGTVISINTVVAKPLEIDQGQTVTFEHGTNGKPLLQGSYGADPYSTRPYELPVVQSKPFGVYNGYVDPATSYGYKQKQRKPDYEIVHGIPAHNNKDAMSTFTQRTPGGQVVTPISPMRDDTIDLKPPAIIPQFGAEVDRPARPYPRPAKPIPHLKPEILTKPPIKLEVRPDYVVKRPSDVRPNTAETFINQTLDYGIKMNHDLQNWNVDTVVSDIVKSQQKVSTGHVSQISETNVKTTETKNGSASRPITIGNNRPIVIRPDHGTFTRVHPEYPHILTKPKPQVPGPVIVSSGVAGLETGHSRPNVKFSMPVEVMGEEVDSKTQTERPPSMLVTKNGLSHNKNDEILQTAHQMNPVSSQDMPNKMDGIKTKPINAKETNVPSRNMMPPPLNADVGSKQANKEQQEGLKPPPPPLSSDVLGLSPPPVDITTTHTPIEDRFALMTTDESDLKPPKYVLLKESVTTVAPPPPSTSMVPPSPRPSLTRPFLVELLSQVRL